jgi:hypothetical protein
MFSDCGESGVVYGIHEENRGHSVFAHVLTKLGLNIFLSASSII